MILKKLLLVLVAFLMVGSVAKAADKTKKVYVYGIAISFNDSTVYMTDIQTLDSAAVKRRDSSTDATTTLISCATT